MKKILAPFAVAVAFVIFFIIVYLLGAQQQVTAPTQEQMPATSPEASAPDFSNNEDVFKNALNLYIQKKKAGVDMTNGPCLGKIGEDWVLDIAHNPRLTTDDKAENQCADFVSGKVKHFIELDPEGKLIRSQ